MFLKLVKRKIRQSNYVLYVISTAIWIGIITFLEFQTNQPHKIHHRPTGSLSNASLIDRIFAFNFKLELFRTEYNQTGDRSLLSFRSSSINQCRDFVEERDARFPQVITLRLPWIGNDSKSLFQRRPTDTSNLIIQEYYDWSGSNELCFRLSRAQKTILQSISVIRTCLRTINFTMYARPLAPFYLAEDGYEIDKDWPIQFQWYRYPDFSKLQLPLDVLHLRIILDVGITDIGDILSGNLTIMFGCRFNHTPTAANVDFVSRMTAYLRDRRAIGEVRRMNQQWPRDISASKAYDEVYVITFIYGRDYYHYMIEIISRLAAHLDFLRENPEVKIHVPENYPVRFRELLVLLGLEESRFVTGVVKARLAYLPRSFWCLNNIPVPEVQMLSCIYKKIIEQRFGLTQPRNRIILIKRTHHRFLTDHDLIAPMLADLANQYNLLFTVFTDDPMPSLNDTMLLFHSALLVIGPHGAGLSNIIFSRPPIYVVEGVCDNKLLFQKLAHVLGHHWHGIVSRNSMCQLDIHITVESVKHVVVQILLRLNAKS